MTDSESEVSPEVARLVADAADAFQARRARGEEPDPEEYAARYPAAADAIRGVLGVLRHAPIASPDSSLAPQPRVLGDFRIIRQVGRGGMGIVYEAVQISLGRRVALKVLPFAALVDDHLLQRFHTEARAAAGLDHPNVVQVHAVGEERGTHFIAMQFIDGRPLSDLLRDWHGAPTRPAPAGASAPTETYEPGRAGGAGSTRPAEAADRSTLAEVRSTAFFHRAAELAVQAARALAHAHAADVFHRDIKPGNLLVDASRHLWVSDFGLAKMKASDAGLTRTGDVFGTLRYLSPEQAHGQNDQVDGRTDVYALGATLYELLTGHPVVTATERLQILWQVIHDLPVPLRRWNRAIPPDLEAVCLKCLEKDPNRRYQTAGAMADDLGRWMDGLPTVARPLGVWGRSVRRVQRRRSAVLVGALIVGCLGFAGTAAYLGARPPAQTVESGGTDRREGLRELGTAVAKGEPARVIGTTGGPVSKWKEWIVGGGRAQFSLDDADLFTIHTQEVALLELLPRVEYDTYELTAEVRHDEATALGCVGLYVGRVAYPRTPNDLHFLVHLTFNAVKADAPVQLPIPGAVQPGWTNRVDLALRLLAEKDVNSHVSLGTRISGPEVPALGKNNNRWFSLAVRVSPDGILATFDGERIELTREKIADLVEKGLPLVRAKHPGDASIQNVRPAFDPRGGLGLYLRYGSAAVRNVIVQRLAPNP